MPPENLKRKLAAILSADVTQYSRLMREDEEATIRTLSDYREVISALVDQHHGRVVDAVGDNLLAEFASVVDAVQGAIAIQKEIKSQNAQFPDNRKMLFRIGINLGDLVVNGDRIYGDGVNIAARLESMADPGGICISRTAYDQIEDKLPLGYEYLGEKAAKNIVKPIRAYKVLFEAELESDKTKPIQIEKEPIESTKTETRQAEKYSQTKSVHSKDRRLPLRKHLWTYAGIIGFLFIINMLTSAHTLWFYWPALGWGLFLFMHWVKISKQ
jgi:adenylate cyclase